MPTRTLLAVALTTAVFAGCTAEGEPSSSAGSPRCDPGPGCVIQVESSGVPYRLECVPVPEALVDVELPRNPETRPLRAIAGVASTQGVAAMWRDPAGCGLWVLALADGLSTESATSIRDEIARGVERFGVTASPVPHDVGGD